MISIHSTKDQEALRASCHILAKLMNTLIAAVVPGVSLLELEQLADQEIKAAGAIPAFKGYHGYKNILCTSVNEEVVHCPPSGRKLKSGDIISIDAGVIYQGMYSDCAVTVPVGEVSPEAKRLIEVTRTALYDKAKSVIKPGNTVGDIGHAIQTYVEDAGFTVVRSLVGHGIGKHLHEEPSIPNYGKPGTGVALRPGMAIAVEPMVNAGVADVEFQSDGWRVVTADGKMSAHFEHTFLVTASGCEILTKLK